MARGQNTRKSYGVIAIHLNAFEGHPEWRGNLKLGADEFDVSLWVDQRIEGSPLPIRMTGEVTLKPRD